MEISKRARKNFSSISYLLIVSASDVLYTDYNHRFIFVQGKFTKCTEKAFIIIIIYICISSLGSA
jgi:hypothetical protein